jgi:hypothetical protein
MLTNRQYWTLTAIAAASVVAVITNMAMYLVNRTTQAEINTRVQFLQQTAQLDVLYREMVKALADLSVRNQDRELQELLTSHGITVNVAPATGAAAERPETAK